MELLCWSAPSIEENLAFDEAVAKSVYATGNRLLRFWWGDSPAIVMGSSQRAGDVADTTACTARGVPILKRCSGGGAVLENSGVFNYTLITPAPSHLDVAASFQEGTDLVRSILANLGIAGVQRGTSDVAVGDRKISGNALARRWKAQLVHGTLLVDFDFDLADQVLKYPPREPDYRHGRSHREFLVTLRELGVQTDRERIEEAAFDAAHAVLGRRICETDSLSLALPPTAIGFPSEAPTSAATYP